MDRYERFKEHIEINAEKFKEISKKETIRLVSHLDADGISASAILIKMLNSDSRKYSISVVQQLDKKVLEEISKEPYDYFIFSDLGSGQLGFIKKYLANKTVFILDHHKPEDVDIGSNIIHINPHLFGIDGSKEIAGAGVVYMFARLLNKKIDDMAHIAIIGAVGDIQEDKGFLKLNNEILETAIKKGKIKLIKGLRIFGAQTKPLQSSTYPGIFIPGDNNVDSHCNKAR